jgi:photosystem II stability/assembly factor-like uncharacterized protein
MIRASTWWNYRFTHRFHFMSVIVLSILIPASVFLFSNTQQETPVMSIAAANAAVEPVAQPVSFSLNNDVNALQQQSLLAATTNERAQAADAMNNLRQQWSNAIGVSTADWNVSATASQNLKVLVAVKRDLYTSTDGGRTFNKAANVLPGALTTLAISPANLNELYAGVDGLGFYVSTDNGQTWMASNAGLEVTPGARLGITAIVVNPTNAHNIYIASGIWLGTGDVTYYPLGILKTNDGGKSWVQVESRRGQPIQYLYLDSNTLHAWSDGQHLAYRVN